MAETSSDTRRPTRFHGSVIFPLILITLGIVFFLNNTGALSSSAWDVIVKLWPLLLIALGLDGILRRQGVAGPIFWLGLGTVLVLSNFEILAWSFWDVLLRLWPVLLIAIGVDIAFGRQQTVWGAILAFVIIVIVLAGALLLAGLGTPTVDEPISYSAEGLSHLSANLYPTVGDLRIEALPESGPVVLQGVLHKRQGETVNKQFSPDGSLTLRSEGFQSFYPRGGHTSWGWELAFAPALPLDLQVSQGVGTVNLDLTDLLIRNLNINLGVGDIVVILPQSGQFTAAIEGAVGQITILVPKGAVLKITSDTALANLRLPDDFIQRDDGYVSPAYEQGAVKLITLNLSQAVGTITVEYR